ncbi:Glycerophosphoryl diester phosphodiesterase [Pedobacter westerhofensis]|uniref:Glycerophosphoryl diester phosphodiesterase n=1 Tax=Pedobacter westerhofensis TaxID=425512 RepID=A0A521CST0_9SPHI|nr:glycerophosphodiester phosphodiesterase family protein [Pedobacter westerhofensis]SMO62482.1 Glycerophosphoryl diester phosphodiesterase [Pedobacter westerhofensis]
MNHQLMSWLTSMPIAHRGLYDEENAIPENSMTAFEKAIEHNYAIELDVYVTLSHEVVVFHDPTLRRMCGVDKRVESLTKENLARYQLLRTGERIPLLKDVLRLVRGRVPLLIEIKRQPWIKNANMVILNTLLGYKGEMAVQSFDPFVLGWFARKGPMVTRGQLASDFRSEKMHWLLKYLLCNLKLNFISKPHFLAYDAKALPKRHIERRRKKNGMIVLGWTVADQAELNRIKPHCDNIIFERFRPG